MKRFGSAILSIVFFIVLLFPAQVFAASEIGSTTYYLPPNDQYRVDYSKSMVQSAASYELHFTSSTNEVFTGQYDFSPTGVHYLTCNGIYKLNFYDGNGALIFHTANIVTTLIINPTCQSYADGISGNDSFTAVYNPDGSISWNLDPGVSTYEIWKDGVKVSETSGSSFPNAAEGSYSIIGKDSSGNIVGQSDLVVKNGGGESSGCDVCEKLSKLLACPDWERYMGELSQAIKNGLPTLPEWRSIADQFVGAFEEYFGAVPASPTQIEIDNELDKTLPAVNAGSPEAESLVPTVPAGYETPIPFDISSGPQITIVDESVPFTIINPLNNLIFDEPGVPVIPGDARNNTGDIQKPAIIAPYPVVTPKPMSSTLPDNPVPIPKSSPGSAPMPNGSGGSGPIPIYKGG